MAKKASLNAAKRNLNVFRKKWLIIEEIQAGISIMDLGLNEFRLDLLELMERNPEIRPVHTGYTLLFPLLMICRRESSMFLKPSTKR
jgi:hypothetical protein